MTLPRPSTAGRWVPCPASVRLESNFPDVESEDAREGIAAHWLAQQVLGGYAELEELTDRTAPNGVIIDGDMVEHIETYITAVHQYTTTPVVEASLSMPEGIEAGTPDARAVNGSHGVIWDLKYGWHIVETPGNWQLACYIVALFAKHEWNLDVVTGFIVQPRPSHPDGRVRSWQVTRFEAIALYHQLVEAAARTQQPDAPTVTGPHCRDCRALHQCEAARQAAINGIDVAFRGTLWPQTPYEIASELNQMHRALDAIKQRADALEAHATALIDNGTVVPGWSLERSFGRRRWSDGVEALEALTGTTLTETKPVTPREAERKGVDPTLVKMFTTTPETGRKLVARDASKKAAEVFK